jgi:hypothetical protein
VIAPALLSGSYATDEVTFLLQPLTLQPIADVREKERLIQSGQRHYSDMLSPEVLPASVYLQLFHDAVAQCAPSMARCLVHLARRILLERSTRIVLVSLARAGTPVGVLLRRLMREVFEVDAPHYSISIVRGRGIDACALDHIVARHPAHSLVFVDGWSAKGSIAAELLASLGNFETSRGLTISAQLFVLSDLSGLAHACATHDDVLLPHALLNATVSGLVSRSVWRTQELHGCVVYSDWQDHDRSRWFVDKVWAALQQQLSTLLTEPLPSLDPQAAQQRMQKVLAQLPCAPTSLQAQRGAAHQQQNYHLIKPGIGEATRALLRRAPRLLILRDAGVLAVRHLVYLAGERGVPLKLDPSLAFEAVAIIGNLCDG